MRFLIVDDDLVQLESIDRLLRAAGHTCHTAMTNETALSIAALHPPDVAVLDYISSGRYPEPRQARLLLESLRGLTPGLPVVIATGWPLDGVVGFEGCPRVALLQKPFYLEQLLTAVAVAEGTAVSKEPRVLRSP